MDETTQTAEAATTYDLSYVPTAEFLRRAQRRWVWRAYGGFVLGLVVVAAAAVVLAPDMPWLSGLFAGIVLSVFTGTWRSRRAAHRQLERFADEPIEIRLAGDGLTFRTPDSSVHLAWSELSRVDVLRDVWMLRIRGRGPVFLPSEILRGEPGAYFREKLQEHRILIEGLTDP